LRALNDEFGTRSHDVYVVAVNRPGRMDGGGPAEILKEVKLSPTPKVTFNARTYDPDIMGWVEAGAVKISEISLSYKYEELVLSEYDDNEDVEVFYELIQKVPATATPERQRYKIEKLPVPQPSKMQWVIGLVPSVSDRLDNGDFESPYDEPDE